MTRAEVSFKRADRLYHGAVKLFFIFAFVMLIIIIWQVAKLQGDFTSAQTAELRRQETSREDARKRLDKALAETQKQQIVTQNYIRCVAVISLLPIEQRSAKMLDECGIPGVTDPAKLGQPQPNQSAAATQPAPVQSTPAPQQPEQPAQTRTPAAGAPPDDNRSPAGKLPIIGGLLDAIGL